jgi:hypothetical protein
MVKVNKMALRKTTNEQTIKRSVKMIKLSRGTTIQAEYGSIAINVKRAKKPE